MKRTRRAFCLFLALLIAASFLSSLFLTLEHDCTHDRCQICSFVSSIKKLLGALCLASAICWLAGKPFIYGEFHPNSSPALPAATSPVTLKVKLSN